MFRPAQNIGFAIPVNTLKQILPQLREKGKVIRGFLGINIVNVDSDRAAAFGLKSEDGAFVESVEAGKPAEKAGVKPGDTIVKVDSVPVKDTRDLIGYVSGKAPGSKVQLGVVRDGKEQTLTATLSEREGEGGDGENPEKVGLGRLARQDRQDRHLGQELTPQVRQMQRIKAGVDGLLVVRVKEVSAGRRRGHPGGRHHHEGQRPEGGHGRGVRQARGEREEGRLPQALRLQPARQRLPVRPGAHRLASCIRIPEAAPAARRAQSSVLFRGISTPSRL